jgi:hypothetical protein
LFIDIWGPDLTTTVTVSNKQVYFLNYYYWERVDIDLPVAVVVVVRDLIVGKGNPRRRGREEEEEEEQCWNLITNSISHTELNKLTGRRRDWWVYFILFLFLFLSERKCKK